MNDLATRGAPYEYWFLKLNAGDLAFLVDFMVRRPQEEAEVRISLWVRGQGRVERALASIWHAGGWCVDMQGCSLEPSISRGHLADIRWELSYEPGPARLDPQRFPLGLLHPLDMEIVSRPQARFSGLVWVGGESFVVDDAPGMVSHYWGARLPARWYWVSANQFEDAELALEAVLLRSRLWGLPRPWPQLTAGYFYLRRPGGASLIVSPLTGLIGVSGIPGDFTLTARDFAGGERFRLRCTAPPHSYNDLGDGIRQTLIGSCHLDGVATAHGTAGLEIRA